MRIERGRPWCWQYKEILRRIKDKYEKRPAERAKMVLLYCTITWIQNDDNGKPFTNHVSRIRRYSGLPYEWITNGIKQLEEMEVIKVVHERTKKGQWGDKYIDLVEMGFEPLRENNGKKPGKQGNLPIKSVAGKTLNGFEGTLEEHKSIEEKKKINYRPVWDFYNKRYTEVTGDKAVINYAKASQVLRPYVEKDGPEETVRKMGTWFDMEIGKWCGYAIYNYATDYAKIVLANGKGSGGKIDYGFDKLDM